MHPLRVAFLWHFHQPDYRSTEGFALPWVRLHAAKDYAWLPELVGSYPSITHTFNVVPSLLDQLAAYGHGTTDLLQREAEHLLTHGTPANAALCARALTVLHAARMITHPRHDQLHQQALGDAWNQWTTAEWIDLMVWYHLAWCSPQLRRDDATVRGLLSKGQSYAATDLHNLMRVMREACVDVILTLKTLFAKGSIALSVTPYHHPILPLLCSTDATREAIPNAELPEVPFAYPDDASSQVSEALRSARTNFDATLSGMWPAEGSVSNHAIELFARNGVRWIASDEGVLERSLGDGYTETSKFHAWDVGKEGAAVSVLFRDRALSDAIGFVYSTWEAERAADDFIRLLEERRRLIVHHEGEDALLDTAVAVILDGENCWEFFPDNGEHFVRALCNRLSDTTRYACIGMDDATRASRSMRSIVAGSWIGASFDVWIGSPLKNLAWTLLGEARAALSHLDPNSPEKQRISDEMLSAESSDWFWWYDERHQAPNKLDFDILYRAKLSAIFTACGVRPSVDLSKPLYDQVEPSTNSDNNAVHITYGSVAMHAGNQIVHSVTLERDNTWNRICVNLERELKADEHVLIKLHSDGQTSRQARVSAEGLVWTSDFPSESLQWMNERTLCMYVESEGTWTVDIEEGNTDQQRQSAQVVFKA